MFLASAALIQCRSVSATPEIRIGLLALLSSDLGPQSGTPSVRGAQLAVDEINAEGGVEVNGRRRLIRLILRDYEPRPDAAASGARALINLDSVDVLVGPQLSAHALAAATVAEDSRVPMIAPMASNPSVTEGRNFVFRLAFLDQFQGEMLARYSREELGAKRAAMLYDEANPYGRDISALFKAIFESTGGVVVSSETFTSDQRTDFRPQLRRIAATNPDVLLLPNYSAMDTIQVRQARELGIRARFLGSDTWDPRGMMSIPAAIGTIVAHQWHVSLPRAQSHAFVTRYTSRYGEQPRSTAALTYDAVRLVASAITRAGTVNGAEVAGAISSTNDYEGASGRIAFGGAGNPARTGVLSMLSADGNRIVRMVEPGR